MVFIVLMFLGSTLPDTIAAKSVSLKGGKDRNSNFNLNATLDTVYETYKDYQALVVKIDNFKEDVDELKILANRGDLAGLDTDPYYNKKDILENEMDALNNKLADSWAIIKKLNVIKANLNTRIEDKLEEINKTEYKYSQYSEELDDLLDKLAEAETNYPAMIKELNQKIDDILIQLEYLTKIYECRSAVDMNTTALEQQINELSAKYYLYSTMLHVILDEPEILESKIEHLLIKLIELEAILEGLYNELRELEDQLWHVREAIEHLKTMIGGTKKIGKVLSKIPDKLGRLKKILKKISSKRGGSKKDKPEPLIESELVPLNLPGMTSSYAVIKILVIDELKTSDPREEGKNCLLQISMDGRTWYPLELDLVAKDGFYFGYLANKTGKYYFKASMSNWYGNLGFDTDTVVYRGTEPEEKLEPDVSVVNVSFTYWYDDYTIQCTNQQQLVPTQNLVDDSNIRSNSLFSSLKGSSHKSAYQRSFVSYQDGDDIIAVGYAEINPNAPGPLRVVQGDSFSASETEIVSRGKVQNHQFVAIPPYDDAPMVIINNNLGIIESINRDPNDSYPGSTTTYIKSDIVLLNIDSDESIDCNFDISLRTNISYFVDPTNDDNSNMDSEGINETEAGLKFKFTGEDDTSRGSELSSFLEKLSPKAKAKFKKWKPRTKLGNKIKSGISKFGAKIENKWNNITIKYDNQNSKFRDRISFKFKGLSYKWLSRCNGLWGRFKGKYKDLFEETNSTFKGLLNRLDFNVSKKTGEDVKNFCGSWIKKASSRVKKVVGKVKGKLSNFENGSKFKDYPGYHSKKKTHYFNKFNNTLKQTMAYTSVGDEFKKEMDRTVKGTNQFSGIGIKHSKSQIFGNWVSKGMFANDNETNKDTNLNDSEVRVDNNSNNKEFNYYFEQNLLEIPEQEEDKCFSLYETMDLAIDIKPPEQDEIGPNSISNIHDSPRIALISYTLQEVLDVSKDGINSNDLTSLYDTSNLDFELIDETFEDVNWYSEDVVSGSMSRSVEASSYKSSGFNNGPDINVDMSNLWPETESNYDVDFESITFDNASRIGGYYYYDHDRYSEEPNLTKEMLDNLTTNFVINFDQIYKFNEESEIGSDGRNCQASPL